MGTEYNSATGIATHDDGASFDLSDDQGTWVTTTDAPSDGFQAATGFEVPGNVMSTARGTTGSPVVNREVQPTDTIETHGLRMTVAMAAQMGFLTKDSSGLYAATPLGQAGAKGAAAPTGEIGLASGGTVQEAKAGTFMASQETEEALGNIISKTMQSTQMAAIDSIIRNGGVIDENVLGRLATQVGVDPDVMAATVASTHDGMQQAMMKHLAPMGVYDADAFAAFVHSDPRVHQRMVESVRDLMSSNSTKGFESLAAEFTEVADKIDPTAVEGALADAGIPFRRTSGGGVILDLKAQGYGELSFQQAVKIGIIKLSRNH